MLLGRMLRAFPDSTKLLINKKASKRAAKRLFKGWGCCFGAEERLGSLIASLWLKEVERNSREHSEGAQAGRDKLFPMEQLGVTA